MKMAKVAREFGLAIAAVVTAFSLFACANAGSPTPPIPPEEGTTTTPPPPPKYASRYETVPVKVSDYIMWYDSDGESNYYFLNLGFVKKVPISASTPLWYDGKTPLTVSFSKSTVTETSVQNSVETCVTNSVTVSKTNTYHEGIELGFGGEKSPIKVKPEFWAEQSKTTTDAYEKSIKSTYATATSEASSLTETLSYTIGENGETVGKYRYALFSACDVYLLVETDRQNTKLIRAESSVVARENAYTYVIDYDPDINGTFAKNSDTDPIDIAADFYKNLPIMNKELVSLIFNTDGGNTINPRNVAVGAPLPLPGLAEPKREGYAFAGWDTGGYTAMPNKDLTITAKWIKTVYKTTFRQGAEQKITSDSYSDNINDLGFNIAALKTAGYKQFTVKVTFDIREQNNGTQRLKVKASGSEIGSQKYDHGGSKTEKNWISGYAFSGTYDLADTLNKLTLEWDSPKDNWLHINTWYLGNTQVTVTAIK